MKPYRSASAFQWLFSLEYPFFFVSMGIYSTLFVIFVLVFVLTRDHDAIIALGIIFHVWGWGIWAFQLWVLIRKKFWAIGSRLFAIPTFLYLATVYQFTMVYAIARDRSSDTFIGAEGDLTRIEIIGILAFLANETIGSLGTGSIFGNTSEFSGPFLIALNSIAAWVLVAFIFSVVVVAFDEKVEKRIDEEIEINGTPVTETRFYKKYNQWLYYTKKGKRISYVLSLEYPYFLVSVPAYFVLSFLPFILVFSLTNNSPAIIALGVINLVWSVTIWAYQLFLILSLSFKKIDITVLSSPAWLFLVNLVAFAVIYSVIRHEDADAFVGFFGNFSNISIFGIASFLSSETSTGLGTGATFANTTTWVPFLMVSINSIMFLVLNTVLLSSVIVVFSPHARLSKMVKGVKSSMTKTKRSQKGGSKFSLLRRF